MHTYQNARVLTLLVTTAFSGLILLSVVASISTWFECSMLQRAIDGAEITESEAMSNDLRQGLIGLCQMGLYIATVVLFCVWLNRANKNARALGAQDMQFTPGWSVGYFFIPIINIYRPYQAVTEVMRASDPEARPFSNKPWQGSAAAITGWWWAAWLASNALGQIAFRLSMRAETLRGNARKFIRHARQRHRGRAVGSSRDGGRLHHSITADASGRSNERIAHICRSARRVGSAHREAMARPAKVNQIR